MGDRVTRDTAHIGDTLLYIIESVWEVVERDPVR